MDQRQQLQGSTEIRASLLVGFFGDAATLTMGTGPDHSLYDVYIDGSLWQSFNGYSAIAGQVDIVVTLGVNSSKLTNEGLHVLEIRNRAEHQSQSSGTKVRFKQLLIADKEYDLQTISYSYDALSRLKQATYAPGLNTAADADTRQYGYSYDVAGNRTQQIVTVAGSPTTTNYTYNAANQLTSDGVHTLTYDNNGNLTSDGVNSYTSYDRANRLTTVTDGTNASQYAYDGMGRRISQSVNSGVTQYLLDIQPGLEVVLGATTGSNTVRYVHGPKGIHAQKDASNNWEWMLQDGLGSVRLAADSNNNVLWNGSYEPYGVAFGTSGTNPTVYSFTGEMRDPIGLQYHRARYLNPALGVFTSLDPFEGVPDRAMSLNGYAYVTGNPVNLVDPSGLLPSSIISLINDFTCGAFFKQATQEPQSSGCDMPYEEGVAVLAYAAGREGNGTDRASAALMLMEMNAYRTPRRGVTGQWTLIGATSQAEFIANALRDYQYVASEHQINLAGLMVSGYRSSCDPLRFFETGSPVSLSTARTAYPEVAANLTDLQSVASRYGEPSTALQNEYSVHPDRVADIRSYYSNPPIYVAGGVVISTGGQTFPPLLYQCPSWATAVRVTGNPDQIGPITRNKENYECLASCRVSEWWLYLGDLVQIEGQEGRFPANRAQIESIIGHPLNGVSGRYASVTADEANAVRRQLPGRGLDYVKSCG